MSLEGTITSGIHRLTMRVYYEDTDFSGYVYHANYLKFCERARSDLIRLIGFDQNTLADADNKAFFVIRKMNCDYLKPARFDDVLTVESHAGEIGGARFQVWQKVLRGDEVLFTADVTAVLIDGRGRPKRIPVEMVEKFSCTST
jgi:acyl-CoA thioester hydrolase